MADTTPTDHPTDAAPRRPAPARMSVFDQIKADINNRPVRLVDIKHPGLPDYVLRCTTNIDGEELERFRHIAAGANRKSRRAGRADGDDINPVKLNSLVVGEWTVEILRQGEVLTDDDGDPINFGTREFMDAMSASTKADAARAFLGSDAYLSQVSNVIIDEAGFMQDAEVVDDPTR